MDAFQELDTERHSWEVLAELLTKCTDILVDVGMPVNHVGILISGSFSSIHELQGKIAIEMLKRAVLQFDAHLRTSADTGTSIEKCHVQCSRCILQPPDTLYTTEDELSEW